MRNLCREPSIDCSCKAWFKLIERFQEGFFLDLTIHTLKSLWLQFCFTNSNKIRYFVEGHSCEVWFNWSRSFRIFILFSFETCIATGSHVVWPIETNWGILYKTFQTSFQQILVTTGQVVTEEKILLDPSKTKTWCQWSLILYQGIIILYNLLQTHSSKLGFNLNDSNEDIHTFFWILLEAPVDDGWIICLFVAFSLLLTYDIHITRLKNAIWSYRRI